MVITWFRVHHKFFTSPKLRSFTLADRYRVMCLFWLASESNVRGEIDLDIEDISATLEMKDDEYQTFEQRLERKGIVMREGAILKLCNWAEYQYDKPSDSPESVAERKRKQRERQSDAMSRGSHAEVTPCHAEVTPHNRTDTEENRTEQRREERANAAHPREAPSLRVSPSDSASSPNEGDTPAIPPKPPTATPRNLDEVKPYFKAIGGTEQQAVAFWNHYEGIGWKPGGNAVADWWAMARKWRQGDAARATVRPAGSARASPPTPEPRESEMQALIRLGYGRQEGSDD